MKKYSVVAGLLFCTTAMAQVQWQSGFDLTTRALYIESSTQQARSFGIVPGANVTISIQDNLTFFSRASALLETGSYKGTLLDEFKPDQQVVLNHAYFDYRPWESIQLLGGAIPMKDWSMDILIDSTRFLGAGARQKIALWGEAALSIDILGAIPSNQELTNRLGSVSEGTPSYWQTGLSLNLPGDLLGIKTKAYAWGYSNVDGDIAFQSGFMGNQTIGVGSTNTRFAYSYKGFAGSFDIDGEVSTFRWGLGLDYLFNDGAPDERNQATRARINLGHLKHDFTFSYFEIESDASIGYYNNALLGHTNRDGIGLDYTYKYSKDSSVGLKAVRAKTIRSSLLQADQDAISMWWRLNLK